MKRTQLRKIFSQETFSKVFLCCVLLSCSLLIVSCISLPGEKEKENRNIAADYYDIALKYVDQKQYDKAVTCFEKARSKADTSDYAKIDYQMARAYALSNKWKEAALIFEGLLKQDSDNTNIKEAYAYVLYKGGEKEKALQLYAELGKSDPFVKDEADQEAIGS